MVNKLFFTAIIMIIALFGCNRFSKLVTSKQDSNSTTLSLNGYYFVEESGENKGLKSIYFLYKNGVLLYAGSYKNSDINSIEDKIKKNYVNNQNEVSKKYRIDWGIFAINDNKITIEKWEPTEGIKKTSMKKGVILNNQSFRVDFFYSPFTKKEYKISETYYFKEFSPKPDSTNSYIK